MSSKLYKLALWYIKKCNVKWENRHKEKVESLTRLTYWNFGKYMLAYGADAEWQNFSRYDVLDNAIQKLAKYENAECEKEKEIRAKAIDEFAERLSLEISESIIWDMLATMSKNGSLSDTSDRIVDYVIDTAKKIAEEMRGAE